MKIDEVRRFRDAAAALVKSIKAEERIADAAHQRALTTLHHVRERLWAAQARHSIWDERIRRLGGGGSEKEETT